MYKLQIIHESDIRLGQREGDCTAVEQLSSHTSDLKPPNLLNLLPQFNPTKKMNGLRIFIVIVFATLLKNKSIPTSACVGTRRKWIQIEIDLAPVRSWASIKLKIF
jgi:hypothetical protein